MIDYEVEIFNKVAAQVETAHSNAFITNEQVRIPASFPCVCVFEAINTLAKQYQDSSGIEQVANVTYIVRVFSNKQTGAKREARSILETVDGVMQSLNFTRTYYEPSQIREGSVYRIVARYQGQVDSDGNLYRRR